MCTSPPTPIPPATCNAPVVVLVADVVSFKRILPNIKVPKVPVTLSTLSGLEFTNHSKYPVALFLPKNAFLS